MPGAVRPMLKWTTRYSLNGENATANAQGNRSYYYAELGRNRQARDLRLFGGAGSVSDRSILQESSISCHTLSASSWMTSASDRC